MTTLKIEGKDYQVDVARAVKDGYLKEMVEFRAGDIIQYPGGEVLSVLKMFSGREGECYFLGGLADNLGAGFSNGPFTFERLQEYLGAKNIKKIGKIGVIYL